MDKPREPAFPPGDESSARPDSQLPAGSAPAGGQAEAGHAQPQHPEVKFEETDASFRSVLIVALVFCGLLAGGIFFVYRFQHGQQARLDNRRETEFPLVKGPSTKPPPEPTLEPIERMNKKASPDFFEHQRAQERTLHSYGKTLEPGFVRVPVEVAIDALAGHLPVRSEKSSSEKKDLGLLDAGEPNSGRLYREKP